MQHFWSKRRLLDAMPGLRRAVGPQRLSLALQGGGSFGAFTWGVLDRLLDDETIGFDAASGASAGAVNAVALANGLAGGGRAAARECLARVWKRISLAAPVRSLGALGQSAADSAVEVSTRLVSPYQFNPFDLNPLRQVLTEEIDFERLRRGSPLRLLIAATRVKDGRLRIFRDHEITVDAVLASACLPSLHHAVEIDGEWYWDGGYSANPPLRQLILESAARDIVLVQITPAAREGLPRLPPDISRRVNQIVFNGPLERELEAIADLRRLCQGERVFRSRVCRKLRAVRLHRIAAEDRIESLHEASATDLTWRFLKHLHKSGAEAAEDWLSEKAAGGL
ncbi:MAG TPA: patatin-like phospholipase family protein [Candidatus Cybelea sp.]|nr:patatin-like phospholipase family protein [Candidatus Cybelea sp.]